MIPRKRKDQDVAIKEYLEQIILYWIIEYQIGRYMHIISSKQQWFFVTPPIQGFVIYSLLHFACFNFNIWFNIFYGVDAMRKLDSFRPRRGSEIQTNQTWAKSSVCNLWLQIWWKVAFCYLWILVYCHICFSNYILEKQCFVLLLAHYFSSTPTMRSFLRISWS